MKINPAKKTLEQCFLVKTKPTCQKLAIFEHFQIWPKNKGDVLARSPSIVLCNVFYVRVNIDIATLLLHVPSLIIGDGDLQKVSKNYLLHRLRLKKAMSSHVRRLSRFLSVESFRTWQNFSSTDYR